MSKTYFVCSDVHGYYDIWQEELIDAGFDIKNPAHVLIVAGDLLDRGEQPLECLKFVNSLPDDRKILIRGNHEDLLLDVFGRGYFLRHDYHNGTDITVEALAPYQKDETVENIISAAEQNPEWTKYINSCVDYTEVGNYIFVHGWIPVKVNYKLDGDYYSYDTNWRNGDWGSARWLNGMKMWHEGIKVPGKTIVCGHWHCSWGNAYLHRDGKEFLDHFETFYIDPDTGKQEPHENWEPFVDDGIVALDRCTAYTKRMNILVLTEDDLQ